MRNLFLVGLVSVIILFTGACSPSPDYAKATADLAAAQAKVNSLQAKVDSLQVQLTSAQSQLIQIRTKIDILKEYLNSPGSVSMSSDVLKSYYDKIRDKISSSSDQTLISGFKAAENAGSADALKSYLQSVLDSTLQTAK